MKHIVLVIPVLILVRLHTGQGLRGKPPSENLLAVLG